MKPILFNTEMVRAIQKDRKSATRRLGIRYKIKDFQLNLSGCCIATLIDRKGHSTLFGGDYGMFLEHSDYTTGDILYVRETWATHQEFYNNGAPVFKEPYFVYKADGIYMPHWNPSIHMPKEAARIFLRVKSVRVEKLQDITLQDMKNEGALSKCNNCGYYCDTCGGSVYITSNCSLTSPAEVEMQFMALWESTLKKYEICLLGWKANPWVWVIEFEKITKEEAYAEA